MGIKNKGYKKNTCILFNIEKYKNTKNKTRNQILLNNFCWKKIFKHEIEITTNIIVINSVLIWPMWKIVPGKEKSAKLKKNEKALFLVNTLNKKYVLDKNNEKQIKEKILA